MAGPYDYSINVESPLQAASQGVQFGAGLAQLEQQRIAQQQALQQQQRQQEFLLQFMQKPVKTYEDYSQATLVIPGMREQFKQSWEMLNTGQQEVAKKEIGMIFGAITQGKNDFAKQLLQEKISALENSSGDPKEIKGYKDQLASIDIDPKVAIVGVGSYLSAIPGGKEIIESYTKTQQESRAAQEAPIETRKKTAEAIIKETEAKFKPRQLAVELGIKEEELKNARNQDGGIIPAEKRPEAEAKFRKEYSDQTKGYQEVKASFARIQSADQTAAGDLALIFNYMKMLDPGSVVREGEFATAQNAAGVPDRIQNMYNKLLSGERLNEPQRKAFVGQAKRLFEAAGQQETVVRKGIERIAKGYGIKSENIFYEPQETAPTAAVKSGSFSVSAPNGQSFVFPTQQAADEFKRAAGIK